MKLIEKLYLNKQGQTIAYKITLKTGKKDKAFYISDREFKNGTLKKCLDYAFDIPTLIKTAYEAGKNGENFDEVFEEIKEQTLL